jgi:hypothetical protein
VLCLLLSAGWRFNRETNEESIAWLAGNKQQVVERIWDETVLLHGPIGVVWAPYDFQVDGAVSHCRVNVISVVRIGVEWKIADWIWNVRPTD